MANSNREEGIGAWRRNWFGLLAGMTTREAPRDLSEAFLADAGWTPVIQKCRPAPTAAQAERAPVYF
jgi:hypothetical protein